MGKNELKKELGLISALSIVVGMVIGSGVFFKPTAIFKVTGAPGLGLIAWLLGGIISIAGGLTAAEVAAAIPRTGGMVEYLRVTYGDMWAYLLGWAQTVIYFPANIAALAIIFSTQAVSLLNLNDSAIIPIAIIVTIFLIIMNSLGSKTGGAIQTIATAGKLIPLFAIIIFGLTKGNAGVVRLFPITAVDHPVTTSLGSALVATMFAYDGWINVGAIAGEMKNPSKDLPKAIVGGLFLVMAVYLLINVAYLFVLPANVLAGTSTPAADVAKIIFGAAGGKIITIGILVSIFGTLNGYILTGMRIPYVMALENKLPGSNILSRLHPKLKTPIYSGVLLGIISIILIFTGKFDQLTDLLIFVIWIFYVMTFFSVFILRKKQPNLHRPYKVPFYPIVPVIAILGGLYIIMNTLITQPINAFLGIGITIIGLPIYIIRKNKFTVNN
ncbi:serine/threonine exchanger SteT [Clostridium acetireducens DSM 10703]|jgi:APA family basic amino acid/polyamine antiporter|uniref:Serine/threonine exchanger SteT n=1 Tax=Clostridium acetireducens DSM 10703 TaxID=1121290 RepID=A0A1E8F2S4_9CLOT|nr:amino acid permease [Clostridium acetireducens]OFI07658.1 serine/threonine exchanger SteT [Clostridium acetireducens DSM 10703]